MVERRARRSDSPLHRVGGPAELCRGASGSAAAPAIRDFFGTADPWLGGYFQLLDSECALYDELHGGDPRRPVESLFLEQTQHLVLRHLVRRIEEYIEASMGADVSLHMLAELAHMSVDHLVRAFHAATGKTPHRFVLDRRLDHAVALLKARGASIAEIARACGFRSAAHFSVKFHARFGVSPSQYRRSA